jgi:hypothetical protein
MVRDVVSLQTGPSMKLMPIVFAFAVGGGIVWRWARLGWPARLAAAGLSAALALYGAGVFHLPELEKVVGSVGSTLGPYTYALVGVMAFLETGAFVGLLAPGETVVIVGGVVAGQGHIDLLALLGLTGSARSPETSPVMHWVVGSDAGFCSSTGLGFTSPRRG